MSPPHDVSALHVRPERFATRPRTHIPRVEESWAPQLLLRERDGRCRLTLVGLTHGDGATLQEAGDDLVRRVLEVAYGLRFSGFGVSSDLPPPDYRLLAFLWEVADRAASGEDVQACVFGAAASAD